MRIAYCPNSLGVCLALLPVACSGSPPVNQPQGALVIPVPQAESVRTAISIGTAAGPVTIPVDMKGVQTAADRGHDVELLRSESSYLVVIDSWASAPEPLSRCGAGQERFVRVVSLTPPRETFAYLVESCLRDVVPADPMIEWHANGFTLHVLSGAPSVSLLIASDGTAIPR